MAAIQTFNPGFRVFDKFEEAISKNFFKYRGFSGATNQFFNEVVDPFMKSSINESGVTVNNIETCSESSGPCQESLQVAEVWLMTPIELFKVQSELLSDIGAGYFLKFVLEGGIKIKSSSNYDIR